MPEPDLTPPPLVCGNCGKNTSWKPDPDNPEFPWKLDGEWWIDPANRRTDMYDYTCSRNCYLTRYQQTKWVPLTSPEDPDAPD